jgi:hypothetical protein
MMNKDEAIAELLGKADALRRHTITKIRVRRRYRERHKDFSIDLLLASAKRDFVAERYMVDLIKKKIERRIGEPIGPIEDQDGRFI